MNSNSYWILDELKKRKHDSQTAIIYRNSGISYAELWEKSENAAQWILSRSTTNVPIIIYGHKEIEVIILMIAALKTGRAYVPLDITYPVQRVEEIAQEIRAEFLFSFVEEEFSYNDVEIVKMEGIRTLCDSACNTEVCDDLYVKDNDNCYILFTSGSTGKPKGVQITKKNIMNFVAWFSKQAHLADASKVVLNQVSYSFDVSVIPLYVYMPKGNQLFCIDKVMIENLAELFHFLKKSNISVWVSTPTLMEICILDKSFDETLLPKLELVILAGEVFTKDLAKSIKNRFEKATMINGYGPTEGTVLLSSCKITDDILKDDKPIPIGKILDDGIYKILDEAGNPVQTGGEGELVVISDNISKGYFNNTAQTERVFFNTESGKRGYRTGDLVREENDLLYYVARKDTQIKLNGFRIELSDISNNLNKLENVSNSVVLPVYKNGKILYLTGFVVLKEKHEGNSSKIGLSLKKKLRDLVPSYMVPRKIIVLEEFPMNINGKIDKKKLTEEYL